MSRIVALPKCFTPEILAGIWDEVLPKGYPDVIRDAIIDGAVYPNPDLLLDFVQASMEYPHFAASRDLAAVLRMNVNQVNRKIYEVKKRARENRK